MSIDINTLDNIAKLAKLKIDSDDKQKYLDSFNKILNAMDALSNIDTTDCAPASHPYEATSFSRKDQAEKVHCHKEISQNAPKMNHGYFLVPKVIEV